jgi:hypothetical protein
MTEPVDDDSRLVAAARAGSREAPERLRQEWEGPS